MASEVVYLNPRAIEPNRDNVRRDLGDIVGLAETIREHGVLQPLGVVRRGDGYRVVYGDRRREAAILVGLDRVPCLLLGELSDQDRLLRNILENLQRLDLNDLDKARGFQSMRALLIASGLDSTQAIDIVTRRLGVSASQMKRYLGLLDLAEGVQALIAAGDLGVTQAQHLRQLAPASRQEAVARLAADEHISAGELAKLASALSANPNIDPTEALAALRRGEQVANLALPQRDESLHHLPPAPPTPVEEDVYPTSEAADEVDERQGTGEGSQAITRDGNRVRKIHSLDSFMDELDRLTRCAQDGDLAKLATADPDGLVKLSLAARQVGFLTRTLAVMVRED